MNHTLKSIENKLLRIFVLINAFALLLAPFCLGQNLSVGTYHTQYVCKDSSAMSWGFQCDGRLGRGGSTYYPGYVNISIPVVKVAAGFYHSLYLDLNGKVWASGKNGNGQLGLGSSTLNIWTPQQISNLDSIVDISAGRFHSLFLRKDGRVYACGENIYKQLGDSTNITRTIPILINAIDSVIAISAGYRHSLFLRQNGDVYAAGSAWDIGLGPNPVYVNTSPPIKLDSLKNIVSMSAGEGYSLFVDSSGHVFGAGDNSNQQLGFHYLSVNHVDYPTELNFISDVKKVVARERNSLFLKKDSTAWICGWNSDIYAGNATSNPLPKMFSLLSGITDLGLGDGFMIFEIGDSVLYSMGDNHDGMLGDGSTLGSYSPVLVTNLCGAPLVLPPNTSSLDDHSINEIVIYPNPASNEIHIKVSNEKIGETYSLIDLFGKVVMTKAIDSTDFYIDTKRLTDGIYYFNVGSFKHKLLIQH